jgi:hypothetical protein
MKKIQFLLLSVLLSTIAIAQNQENEKVIGLNAGLSWTAVIFNNLNAENINLEIERANVSVGSFNAYAGPAVGLTFDYGITNVFSLGALVSRQSITGDIGQYSWPDLNGNQRTESISFRNARNNISLIPRFHYRTENEKLDMYSGFRLGFTFWNIEVNATDPNFDILDKFAPSRPTAGIIPFGLRYYMSDDLGVNFETAIGSPYVFSVGAQYKL